MVVSTTGMPSQEGIALVPRKDAMDRAICCVHAVKKAAG